MGSDEETKALLKAIGRAIEEQGKAMRLLLTIGFVAIAGLVLLFAVVALLAS